jgi:hypothetical protein
VSSRGDAAGNITFAYRDNGSGQLFTRSVSIPARGTIRVDDLNAFVGAPNGSGALTIDGTVRMVASVRVFNTQSDRSTYGAAVLPQDDAVRASRVRIKGVRRDGDYRLNVSISGRSTASDGTVRLFDDNGREVESEPFHVEHDSMVQVSMNRGSGEVRSGELEIETHNGTTVTVVASSVDNRTGDTSVHECEQENERQHDLEIRISPSTASVNSPVTVSIGNSSTISSVRWDFGDGSTGSGLAAVHTYTRSGEFDVTAEVTLSNGGVVRDREDVHILSAGNTPSNSPIDFTWSPISPAPGQEVTFTASRTTSGGSYEWKFPGEIRKSGSMATFVFPTAGSFEVELELEHEGSTTLHARHVIAVGGGGNNGGGGGALDFTWAPQTPAVGQLVTFTASGGTGGTYVFKFPGDIRKSGSVVTFAFSAAGSYEVELELEHAGSTTLHAQHVVTVGGGSGGGGGTTTVDFTWSPASPKAGQSVTFTATASQMPSGAFFKWKMPNDSRPTGAITTYTFPAAGTYEVEVELEHAGSVSIERRRNVVVAP